MSFHRMGRESLETGRVQKLCYRTNEAELRSMEEALNEKAESHGEKVK